MENIFAEVGVPSPVFLFVDSAEISDNYSIKLFLKEANAYEIA
jgi:hypothetical protein